MTNIFTPSPQQSDFFNWVQHGSGSAVVHAVAGAGKTTTLVKSLYMMGGKVFFGAFNKDIVVEIRERAADISDRVKINTMHAEGFGAWRRVAKNVKVDSNKCRDIFRSASEKYPEYRPLESVVLQLVSLAKQYAVGITKSATDRRSWMEIIDHHNLEMFSPDGTDNTHLIMHLARRTLLRSQETDSVIIDFDDMIYTPLFRKVKFFTYDWVLIDEAQDTNAIRRMLALSILKKGGRLVAVGDPHQAIYGFTGADSDSLDLIAIEVNAKILPLTTSFRCPKLVVAYAQQWVTHIQCADTAPDGKVTNDDIKNLTKVAKPGDAVLCRFNAPLVKYVFEFIALGIPAKIQGRDIGEGLKVLARRFDVSSFSKFFDALDKYLESETAKYMAKDQESKVAALEDKVKCLRVIAENVPQTKSDKSIAELICDRIDSIFTENKDKAIVLFSSIHKAKGREWMRVIWLQTGASPWARQDWEIGQEDNLCYVAATRSKFELILMTVPKG